MSRPFYRGASRFIRSWQRRYKGLQQGTLGVSVAMALVLEGSSSPALADTATKFQTTLNVTPILTSSVGGDEQTTAGNPDPFVFADGRLNYRFTQQFPEHLAFTYYHNATLTDNTSGRYTNSQNRYVYPISVRDIQDEFFVYYTRSRVDIRVGYYYHERYCCPGSGDPHTALPQEWHARVAEVEFRQPVLPMAGILFTYTIRATFVPHHASRLENSAVNAYLKHIEDQNREENGIFQRVGVQTLVDVRRRITAFGTFQWGAQEFYDNAPFPYYYDLFDYGLRLKASDAVTYAAEINQRTQRLQGYPFIYPNANHRAKFILSANFKVGTR